MADEAMDVFFMPTRPVDGPGYYLKKNLMGGYDQIKFFLIEYKQQFMGSALIN